MELDGKYLSAFCLAVLVLCPLVAGGCVEEIMQKQGSMECIMTFGTYFANMATSGAGAGADEGDAIIQAICNEEGRAAIQCLFDMLSDCPEILTDSSSGDGNNPLASLGQIEGFDMQKFLKEGALDATCALLSGPCSKVKECFVQPSNSGRMKRQGEQPSSMNNFLMFQTQISMMCGPYKQQMDCMIKALEDCPPAVVTQVEAQFEAALNMSSTSQTTGVVSYKDTKNFINSQCAKLPSDDTCLKSVFLSQNFTKCDQGISMKYSKKKSCMVHELSVKCIEDNVEPKCGEVDAAFLAHNTHMIYPGIPSDCMEEISGSNVVQTSLGGLLIAVFFTMIL